MNVMVEPVLVCHVVKHEAMYKPVGHTIVWRVPVVSVGLFRTIRANDNDHLSVVKE